MQKCLAPRGSTRNVEKHNIETTAEAMTRGKMLCSLPWKSRQEPICRHCSPDRLCPTGRE